MKNYPLHESIVLENFRNMIEYGAKNYSGKVAYSYKTNPHADKVIKVTFDEVRESAVNYGTALVELGCRGEKCAIIGGTSYGWAISYLTLMAISAVTVPCDKELSSEDLIANTEKAECKFVFYGEDIVDKIREMKKKMSGVTFVCINGKADDGDMTLRVLEAHGHDLVENGDNSYFDYDLDPDKLASIVFTSGTTGKGKGVMLTQTNIVTNMTQAYYTMRIPEKTLCVLPLHHTYASTVLLVGHFGLGSEVYLSSGLKYFLKEMKEQQPTHLVLVPLFVETIYKRIWATAEKNGQDKILRALIKVSNGVRKVGLDARRLMFRSVLSTFGGKVDMIICGGAALNQSLIDTFEAMGITMLNGYGITECSPLISVNRNKYQKRGSVGMPLIGSEVKIDSPNEDGEGEICVKSSSVMLGYYKEPEATAAVFDKDGFFHTGDLGKLDDEGWVYITGRIKNLIILSNGKNVYPEEIEAEIQGIYGVSEVVVYAGNSKADPKKDVIVAEIYPDFEALELRKIEDVQKYFKDQIAALNKKMVSYKTIGHVKIRNTEFIKNTTKKITRFNIDKSID